MANHSCFRKDGLTLAELLVASAVMGIICLGFGTLAMSVQMANAYAQEKNQIGQHARVILLHIERKVQDAYATESFPGCVPISYVDGSYDFPQALAVWTPVAEPANDYPTVDQLTLFACDPSAPNRLVQITNSHDASVAPALNNPSAWRTLVTNLIAASDSDVAEISDQLRAGMIGSRYYSTLRFQTRITPDATEIANARNGTVAWEELNWPTSIYSSDSGLRQVWCHFEFQLVPSTNVALHGSLGDQSVPFFGSSALYYQVSR